MAQRFTATGKWDDPWFRKLEPMAKLGFLYLLDSCDHAGVVDLDRELAEFRIGSSVPWNDLLKSDRIMQLSCGKLWIVKFCKYQYRKGLSVTCNAHRSVIEILESNNLTKHLPEGFINLTGTDQDKDKDKDKVTTKEMDAIFDSWWELVPRKVKKGDARRKYEAAFYRLRREGMSDPDVFLAERMDAFSLSDKGRGKYCPYPSTWLHQEQYHDDESAWKDFDSDKPKGLFT